jgi:hypothetical protein
MALKLEIRLHNYLHFHKIVIKCKVVGINSFINTNLRLKWLQNQNEIKQLITKTNTLLVVFSKY